MDRKALEAANEELLRKRAELNRNRMLTPISELIRPTLPQVSTPCDVDADLIGREAATWECDDCGQSVEPITWELEGATRHIMRQFCDCPLS